MSNNIQNNQESLSAIALAKTDNELRAVNLQKQGDKYELLWAKNSQPGAVDWKSFAVDCGIDISPAADNQSQTSAAPSLIVGFNSAGTAFYSMSVPVVEDKEVETMVQLQAESQLPLPAEQMELAWRSRNGKANQLAVTMAAARKQHLQGFVDKVKVLQPEEILLDCEAVVEVWRTLFSGREQDAVIISTGKRDIQICLVEAQQLSNAVAMDIGIDDFSVEEIEQDTETKERLIQDIRSIVDLFSQDKQKTLPIIVLSDGSKAFKSITSILQNAGLQAQETTADVKVLTGQQTLNAAEIYQYRVSLGLALMGLKPDTPKLNLFINLYNPAGEEKPVYWLYSPKYTGIIAAAVVLIFVVVTFAVDLASPGTIEKRIQESGSEADLQYLMDRQRIIKTIAANRPNILELINEIQQCAQSNIGTGRGGGAGGRGGGAGGNSGIQLESFHFKKGQPVQIQGTASNTDALYQFETKLEERPEIKDVVRVTSSSSSSALTSMRGGSGGRIQFTITFHYKTFTASRS